MRNLVRQARTMIHAMFDRPKTRGSREERTHSQAAQTGATFETQTIRRDSFVLQANFVEAAGLADNSVTDMASCLALVSVSVSWGYFKTESSHSLRCDRSTWSTAGTSSSLIITVRFHYVRISYLQVGQHITDHECSLAFPIP
jgi:hypothetical protein